MNIANLIARAIDDNAGMIAIAQECVGRVLLPPIFEKNVVIVRVLSLRPAIEHFVHHQ